jgi:hypothetical protein
MAAFCRVASPPEDLGLRWPDAGFDVAEEQRRLEQIP